MPPSESTLPDHAALNRQHWDDDAHNWVESGERAWAQPAPTWGLWHVSDDECPLLPADMTGMDAIELGCGTGYVSAWMARRGATVTGIDNSEGQLATARRLMAEHDLHLDLIHGNAEAVPREDGSFDFAVSEYGASIWCEPLTWLQEAWRLLRPGGGLAFLGAHPLALVTSPLDGSLPIDRTLHRSWFDLHSLDWTEAADEPCGIEFCLPTSGWFTLFRQIGFVVEDYREPRSPQPGDEVVSTCTRTWGHQFPAEHAWWVRKPG